MDINNIDDDGGPENSVMTPDQKGAEQIVDAHEIETMLDAMAAAMYRELAEAPNLALVGIRRRGDVLARRLQARLSAMLGTEPPCGALDITLYRDDFDSLAQHPVVGETHVPFSVEERTVILIDDVLFTGRTIRAALDELLDLGRPTRIALAVLIDRGWRELPIAADFVGQVLITDHGDDVQVLTSETDGIDAVTLVRALSGDEHG